MIVEIKSNIYINKKNYYRNKAANVFKLLKHAIKGTTIPMTISLINKPTANADVFL